MSAREIIAREFDDEFCGTLDGAPFGEKCAAALTSAGYRLLAPGELDGETLEAAAKVADKREAMAGTVSHEAARALLVALPDAIRALKG